MRKELHGHTSPETAYVVDDYPYGYTARTTIRYWLEHKPSKGYRLVSQTINPKTGRWNKPKQSTYVEIAASMYLDDKGHVQWTGVGIYDEPGQVEQFIKDFPHAGTKRLKVWCVQKAAFAQKLAKRNAEGLSGFLVNGVPQPAKPGDQERHEQECKSWLHCSELLGAMEGLK